MHSRGLWLLVRKDGWLNGPWRLSCSGGAVARVPPLAGMLAWFNVSLVPIPSSLRAAEGQGWRPNPALPNPRGERGYRGAARRESIPQTRSCTVGVLRGVKGCEPPLSLGNVHVFQGKLSWGHQEGEGMGKPSCPLRGRRRRAAFGGR